MEKSGLLRWLLLGLAAFLLITYLPKLFGESETAIQPLQYEGDEAPKARTREKVCELWRPEFHAVLSTRGASLKHFELLEAKYQRDGRPIDLSTTPDLELYRQLRTHFRNLAVAGKGDASWQVDYDTADWKITRSNGKECAFEYVSDEARIEKVFTVTERPYELALQTSIENLAGNKKRHALSVHTAAWRTNEEVEGKMFRVSPYISHVECVLEDGDAIRLQPDAFEPDEFAEEPEFKPTKLNLGDWYQVAGKPDYGAVSNAYFSHSVIPVSSPKGTTPVCQLQIEYRGQRGQPEAGSIYRARIAYPPVELAPEQKASYELLAYVGPKERKILAQAGGGNHNLGELIDLGFFSAIAKILVAFLLAVHDVIPNWGIAIIILTITARFLLFPLSVPSIKSMIKMRELKPELDALNAKYKDDPQAKGLAQMELWRKHNVNPLKGCLPQLASMPVWFALYTTLQTAVELYNIPFLWFPDLSEPDPYFILPFVIGGTSFFQQKIMPMQGDPTQQKMMLYFMPAMFTVFMLFLPAGLGVYMFTNSVLGIVQQLIVERHVKRTTGVGRTGDDSGIAVKVKEESGKSKGGKGGKKQPRSKKEEGSDAKLSESRQLLGKGKA